MTTQHTPGPWATRQHYERGNDHIAIDAKEKDIAHIYSTKADSNLIAAAPELLKALIEYIAAADNSMTDRQLLEDAAKAAGIDGTYHKYIDSDLNCGIVVFGDKTVAYWNPLTDDGDALRLAVKLRLIVDSWADHACTVRHRPEGSRRAKEIATVGGHREEDPYAATRRAITRAAAEIGRAMP